MKQLNASPHAWQRCLDVTRPALLRAPRDYLDELRARLSIEGVAAAVARRDTPALADWCIRLLARQGIANASAETYAERHGSPRWQGISARLAGKPPCPRLASYWNYTNCGYRRSTATCNTLVSLEGCIVPAIPARKGALAEAAVGLVLFIRDICGNDLVGWIDARLAAGDPGVSSPKRGATMRAALVEPLSNVPGTGTKIWSMVLAELLLGADPARERWVATGASAIAVDSLIHNHFVRTGIIARLRAEHPYGPACFAPGGCADIIAGLAERIDASEFDADFPQTFPRWVQFACWHFCAANGSSICNGVRIDDRHSCGQQFCPASDACDRRPLRSQGLRK